MWRWVAVRRRWRRGGPLVVGAVMVVAVGVAVNQVQGPVWTQITAFTIAVVLALGSRMLARRDAGRLALRVPDELGRPPCLGEADLLGLGVQASSFGPSSLYVRRDHEAEQLVADPDVRLVVVCGPRLAGVTRTLAHAAVLLAGDRRLVCFVDLPTTPLRELVAEADWIARRGPGTVLWFDRARLETLEQITPALLDELPGGLRIFVTVDETLLDPAVLPADSYKQLTDPARCVRLGLISPAERGRLAERLEYAELAAVYAQTPVLMGQLMVSFDRAEAALAVTGQASLARAAVLRTVTDWERLQVPVQLGHDRLMRLAGRYWRDLAGTEEHADVPMRDLLRALDEIADRPGEGEVALVMETVLDGRPHHRPHPLLAVIADDADRAVCWAVPDHLWDVLAELSPEVRRIVGLVAYTRGDQHGARRMLTTLDPHVISAQLAYEVGRAARTAGDLVEARRWWSAVAKQDDPDYAPAAMVVLGNLERELGEVEQALRWYQAAIDSGHPDRAAAMVNLGFLEHDQGGLSHY